MKLQHTCWQTRANQSDRIQKKTLKRAFFNLIHEKLFELINENGFGFSFFINELDIDVEQMIQHLRMCSFPRIEILQLWDLLGIDKTLQYPVYRIGE
ncbi:hypothetical protein B4107_1115 [Bacillus safensis]|nr:hypothetical protein B4107_1115 [Bacillus safensis]